MTFFLRSLTRFLPLIIFLFIVKTVVSQPVTNFVSHAYVLNWKYDYFVLDSLGTRVDFINFDGSVIDFTDQFKPTFVADIQLPYECSYQLDIVNPVFIPTSYVPEFNLQDEIITRHEIVFKRGNPSVAVQILPFRINPGTGSTELLKTFEIRIRPGKKIENPQRRSTQKINSVLASGKWFKISIAKSGVFKMDYDFLKNLGLDVDNLDPQNIRIYGNGGGMLPQPNKDYRPEDLVENAIFVEGESDHKFNTGDYILFYGQGPHLWRFNIATGDFNHEFNEYSNRAYYFITASKGAGKRIENQPSISDNANYTTHEYDCLEFHEKTLRTDVTDYVKSGRDWFGETFNLTTSYSFTIKMPGVKTSDYVELVSYVAARSEYDVNQNYFAITAESSTFQQGVGSLNISDYLSDFCRISQKTYQFKPDDEDININYTYSKPSSLSMGWLNYFELKARCNLSYSSGQLLFRDGKSSGNKVTEFDLVNNTGPTRIWDVTYINKVSEQQYSANGENLSFRVNTDTLRQFVAFTIKNALTPKAVGAVPNQDLHGIAPVDMVIIAYPDYLDAAKKLADFHLTRDSLRVLVTTPAQIYNEFSSGAQDITAIRDFMRYLYKNAQSPLDKPEYLLLFGDASYDYKNVLQGNTNFVPTYQSPTIYSPISSYASDDYYGFLDDNEGDWDNISATQMHKIDLQIGRLPVHTTQQAEAMVLKVLSYVSKDAFGDWRNKVTFVADDGDDDGFNDHILQTERLATGLEPNYKSLNLIKIYMDAFKQVSSPNGNKYPDAQQAINDNVNSGSLVVNYIGHGGEAGWAHERVLEIPDINSWTNFEHLALFVTATCEFSRYDDPARVSAGELVLLNPDGGSIAMLTTSRVVYVSANNQLTNNLYISNIFEQPGGMSKTFGEIIVETKDKTTYHSNTRKFILLGDPALRLAYPQYEVVTTAAPDTFRAFSTITIEGEIRDQNGSKMSNFNGIVFPTIYDKKTKTSTLANDPLTKKVEFYTQNNILYRGKATVTNGEFSFRFIVPKDISYVEGNGEISYYATNKIVDAKGYYDQFVVGGTEEYFEPDTHEPLLTLFMGDTSFVFGGKVDENPLMIAKIFDENGINTTGNGIGHELIAELDGGAPIILNNFYESLLNDYQNGVINYPFKKLSEGRHTLLVKVWDIANNSTTAYTEFVVVNSIKPFIEDLFNFPNPFTGKTYFHFKHNLSDKDVRLMLQIFKLDGNLVYSQEEDVFLEGNTFNGMEWNGRTLYHEKLPAGLYIYRIILTGENEILVSKTSKLVIIP